MALDLEESIVPPIELPNRSPLLKVDKKSEQESDELQKKLQLGNVNTEQNIRLRKIFAFITLGGVGVWLSFVVLVICFEGFRPLKFQIGTPALITLLTTTTANVLGTLWIIYRYLFSNNN